MAKPIVVMYIPREGYFGHRMANDEAASVLMRNLNGNFGEEIKDGGNVYHMPDYWTDYYWLVFPKEDITEPELQVFYEKDFTPVKFEELKHFIEEALKPKEAANDTDRK